MADFLTALAERVAATDVMGWRITRFRFTIEFLEGNLELGANAAPLESVRA